jgi:hypothetical protein
MMKRGFHALLLLACSLPLMLAPIVALAMFALGGGPMSLAVVGFAGGAVLARWSRIDIQLAVLLAVAVAQSAAYYALAYNIPSGQLLGESLFLLLFSLPFGLGFGIAGRWFGNHALYRQVDAIWRAPSATNQAGPVS